MHAHNKMGGSVYRRAFVIAFSVGLNYDRVARLMPIQF